MPFAAAAAQVNAGGNTSIAFGLVDGVPQSVLLIGVASVLASDFIVN